MGKLDEFEPADGGGIGRGVGEVWHGRAGRLFGSRRFRRGTDRDASASYPAGQGHRGGEQPGENGHSTGLASVREKPARLADGS
jgi:hypothetical protein